jgi:hypothetical protein
MTHFIACLQADVKSRELSSWLEQRRTQRAESRRLAEVRLLTFTVLCCAVLFFYVDIE